MLIEEKGSLKAVEFKSSQTFNGRHFDGLAWWRKQTGMPAEDLALVYLGQQKFQTENGILLPWREALTDWAK